MISEAILNYWGKSKGEDIVVKKVCTILASAEKYKTIAKRTKSHRIKKKNNKRYNETCAKVGYSERF